MRAAAINAYGGAEVLTIVDLPTPAPGPGELLVRVRAAGVNPVDWKIRSGMLRWVLWLKFPFVPGFDISGEVEQIGPGVTRLRPGDDVYALLGPPRAGGYAELAVSSEAAVARKPTSLTHVEAASMPVAALTSLQALRDLGGLQPGQSALINGASGGVGSFAVQIARALGAHVTGVCGPANLEFVRELGADAVIDYRKEDFSTGGRVYDVIFDAVAKSSFARCRKALTPRGTYITTLPTADLLLNGYLLRPFRRLFGGRQQARTLFAKGRAADLEFLARLVDEGKLRPVVDRVLPLEEVRAAHEYSESERARGKIVLEVG